MVGLLKEIEDWSGSGQKKAFEGNPSCVRGL